MLRAVAQDERSQWRNRELAVERLVEALREALQVTRPRVADRPDHGIARAPAGAEAAARETKRLRRPPDVKRV